MNYPTIRKYPPVTAENTSVSTAQFDNNLSGGDVDIQAALNTLDNLAVSYSIKNIRKETADYTASLTDCYIDADGSTSSVEIKTPASPKTGQIYDVYCYDSTNAVTVNFNGKNFGKSSDDETLFEGENLSIIYSGVHWRPA